MPPLEDYGALIRSGMSLVPDFATSQAAQVGLDTEKLRQKLATVQIADAVQKQQRAATFQQDLSATMSKPDATSISGLIMKYPEFAEQLKSGWDVKDKAAKDADLTQLSEIYSAGSSGNMTVAAKAARARLEADQAAGNADPADEQMVKMLESDDPKQQKAALGMIGTHLAAVTGPEHFGSVYGALKDGYTLDEGASRYDADGNMVAHSPIIKDADGNIRAWKDSGSQPAPSLPDGATVVQPGGFDHAVATVLSNEGGYNPHDMNGAPVNFGINQKANPGVDVKNLTVDQAKQIYHDKYWVPSGAELLAPNLQTPYFDAYIRNPKMAQAALVKSGGDPAKFMDITDAYFQKLGAKPNGAKYAGAWAARDANNRAIAMGAPPAVATSGPPGTDEQFPVLIPGKPKEAPSGYQWSADGKSLLPITGGPADPNGPKNQGPLKPQALEAATIAYAKTGKMPAGMGGQTVRNQILNYLPTIMDRYGLTPDDVPSIQQQFGADAAAFKQRIGQLSYMRQSVGKLNQHAQDLSALIKAIPLQGNFTPFNWITQGAEGMNSNSTIAQLRGGLPLFEGEVARVMTGNPNSGSGQLSDDARHEFDILHSTQAPKAKIDAMNRIMKMVEEAVKATRDETGTLKSRIGGGLDVYAGSAPNSEAQPSNQGEGWITLPSGLKIRKIK